MNITPHLNPTPIATVVNPQTDSLRRENDNRQIITPPTAPSGSAAEKGVADKDKGKTPAQNNEQFDFTELRKKAELNDTRISDDSQQGSEKGSEQEARHNHEHEGGSHDESHSEDITSQEAIEIKRLQQRDQEVRAHELAHASVGGATTGLPSYEFEIGPDGKKYAVAGEVSVDLAAVKGDPRATIAKMEKVHAAALAPANPSSQDVRVAAQATEIIAQAKAELLALELEESETQRQQNKASPYIDSNNVFNESSQSQLDSDAFDKQITSTLKAQESIVPSAENSRPADVTERALRIEGYYSNITQAYEKSSSHQFQLTA